MTRRISIRVLALTVVVLLGFPAQAFAPARYLCHMTGAIDSACCCDEASSVEPHADQPTSVSERGCCERLSDRHVGITATPVAAYESACVPALLRVEVAAASRELVLVPGFGHAAAQPRAPPLFLLNCRFLI